MRCRLMIRNFPARFVALAAWRREQRLPKGSAAHPLGGATSDKLANPRVCPRPAARWPRRAVPRGGSIITHVHYIRITFALHVHYFCITFALLLHYLCTTFALLVHYFCITFALLMHYFDPRAHSAHAEASQRLRPRPREYEGAAGDYDCNESRQFGGARGD